MGLKLLMREYLKSKQARTEPCRMPIPQGPEEEGLDRDSYGI